MKYALCLSGFMRTFRQSMRNLRFSFLDSLNCDIYVSTWDIVGHSKYKFSSGTEPEERVIPDMLRSVYGARLRNYTIRPYDPDAVTPAWIKNIQRLPDLNRRLGSMYYHIWEANRLKQTSGIPYEVTIRCRPDLFFETKISEMIQRSAVDKTVFSPEIESYHHINDQFMFGPTGVMDLVAGLYLSIASPQPYWTVEPAEKTLLDYLSLHQVNVVKLPIKYVRAS